MDTSLVDINSTELRLHSKSLHGPSTKMTLQIVPGTEFSQWKTVSVVKTSLIGIYAVGKRNFVSP